MVETIKVQLFTRASVQQDSKYLYLFTDNWNRTSGKILIDSGSWYCKCFGTGLKYPTMTQAVVRGLQNSAPISTMSDQFRNQISDSQFEKFCEILNFEIETIKTKLKTESYIGLKYSGQFGCGKISNMKLVAPKCFKYLCEKLLELGINNY